MEVNSLGLIVYYTNLEIRVYDRIQSISKNGVKFNKGETVVKIGFVGDNAIGVIINVNNRV